MFLKFHISLTLHLHISSINFHYFPLLLLVAKVPLFFPFIVYDQPRQRINHTIPQNSVIDRFTQRKGGKIRFIAPPMFGLVSFSLNLLFVPFCQLLVLAINHCSTHFTGVRRASPPFAQYEIAPRPNRCIFARYGHFVWEWEWVGLGGLVVYKEKSLLWVVRWVEK